MLVSSDSDFTKLATRLRESGKIVYGFGEMKTPNAFIAACDRFIYLEIIDQHRDDDDQEKDKPEREAVAKPSVRSKTAAKKEADKKAEATKKPAREKDERGIRKVDRELTKLINSSIRDVEDENGWAFLGEVGNLIIKKQPSFDPRNYGYDKLTTLVKAMGKYHIEMRDTGNPNVKHVYLKIKGR